jgi:hypothetical protein
MLVPQTTQRSAIGWLVNDEFEKNMEGNGPGLI